MVGAMSVHDTPIPFMLTPVEALAVSHYAEEHARYGIPGRPDPDALRGAKKLDAAAKAHYDALTKAHRAKKAAEAAVAPAADRLGL